MCINILIALFSNFLISPQSDFPTTNSLVWGEPYYCIYCNCMNFGPNSSQYCDVEQINNVVICSGGNYGCQGCSVVLVRMEPPCPDGGGYLDR